MDQLAKYARVEVYSGSVTPSRVAMMMYAQAHELDHSPAASKEVLQQMQGGMAQVHQQHQHQQLSDGSALLAAHHQGMRQQQQQQQQDGHAPMSQQQQQHGGGSVRGSATPNAALRSRSPGGFSRSSTPSARPFGTGERRFHPLAAIGHTNVMATSGGQLLRADDVRRTPNRTGTPARRSPGATLRSPAQTYAAWA